MFICFVPPNTPPFEVEATLAHPQLLYTAQAGCNPSGRPRDTSVALSATQGKSRVPTHYVPCRSAGRLPSAGNLPPCLNNSAAAKVTRDCAQCFPGQGAHGVVSSAAEFDCVFDCDWIPSNRNYHQTPHHTTPNHTTPHHTTPHHTTPHHATPPHTTTPHHR